MDKLITKFKSSVLVKPENDKVVRFILFMIALIGITVKGIIFQGFIVSSSPYEFNFALGYLNAQPFLLYYYSFALFFLSFALLFKGKGRVIYIFIIDILITSIILLDVTYFRGFLTMPSILLLDQTSNLDNMGATILSMFSIYDILFFVDFIIMGVYIYLTKKSHFEIKRRAIKSFVATLLISTAYIAFVPVNIYLLNNIQIKHSAVFQNMDPTLSAKYLSPVGYHILDIIKVRADSKPYVLNDEENKQIDEFYKMKDEKLPDNEYAGMFKGKNLIVIQVESLETMMIGKEYNGKKITPTMDSLVNTGIFFNNIHDQVNEGTSSDSDLIVNTSMLPLRRGSTFFRFPGNTYNSLPLLLEDEGYSTLAIHPDKGSFWNYIGGLTGIGFQRFDDYYTFDIDEIVGLGLSDKSYLRQVVPKLDALKEPFYGFTVTLTSHGPFDLPKELRQFDMPKELAENEMGGYIESIRYTDDAIGQFLKDLDSVGLLDNTVVAITGDHTGVHKYYNHSIETLTNKEDWFLDDGNHMVPLILWSKDMSVPAKTFNTLGGQVDIMPTILYAMGVPYDNYKNTAMGRPLLNTNRNVVVFNDGSIKAEGLTPEQEASYKGMLELSDKMIRSNYLKDKDRHNN